MNIEFKISDRPDKKYKARRNKGEWVHFGSRNHEHFRDSTPLKAFSHLDHNDPERRKQYIKRHGAIRSKDGRRAINIKFSPAWYSYKYLWS